MKVMLIVSILFSLAGIMFLITSARANDNTAAVGAATAVMFALISSLFLLTYL